MMRFEEDRSVSRYLSRNARQNERSGWNRMLRAGIPASVACLTTPEAIESALPEMERIRRLRDAHMGRRSDVQDPAGRRFWRGIVLELARRGEAEVICLWLGGRMVAYVTCVRDAGISRMWDGRFDPDWAWYSAGRVTDLTAFHRARTDASLTGYDWMRGEEDYKLRLSNHVVETEHLLAWSSAPVRVLDETPRRVRAGLARLKGRSRLLARAWRVVKRRTVARNRGADSG